MAIGRVLYRNGPYLIIEDWWGRRYIAAYRFTMIAEGKSIDELMTDLTEDRDEGDEDVAVCLQLLNDNLQQD